MTKGCVKKSSMGDVDWTIRGLKEFEDKTKGGLKCQDKP
jgi:hypothetical protein